MNTVLTVFGIIGLGIVGLFIIGLFLKALFGAAVALVGLLFWISIIAGLSMGVYLVCQKRAK